MLYGCVKYIKDLQGHLFLLKNVLIVLFLKHTILQGFLEMLSEEC